MQYRYSIIENEKTTINGLQNFFSKADNYSCVGVSHNYDQALDVIIEHRPNVVFINVDNLSENGCTVAFNFVNELYKYMQELPRIIALSSSTNHAYTCIKNNFFDYLLNL